MNGNMLIKLLRAWSRRKEFMNEEEEIGSTVLVIILSTRNLRNFSFKIPTLFFVYTIDLI